MKKNYKIKVNQAAELSTVVDVPAIKKNAGIVQIKALADACYQLVDSETGLAPDNIRVSRSGQDLWLTFEGSTSPDVQIIQYYEFSSPGASNLIGEAQEGRFFAYVPESAIGMQSVGYLETGASPVGMALGTEPVTAVSASVGVLAPLAISPMWAAPLVLLGAAGGGGGGASDGEPPQISLSSSKVRLAAGMSAVITFKLSELSANFTDEDVVVTGGTLTKMVQSSTNPLEYTATLTPLNDWTGQCVIQVASDKFSDTAGNMNKDGADLDNQVTLASDTQAPLMLAATLSPDAVNDTGVSAKDGITSNAQPDILVTTDADAVNVSVKVGERTFTSAKKNAQGQFIVKIDNDLALAGEARLIDFDVVITDGFNNQSISKGQSFLVDRSAAFNAPDVADLNNKNTVVVRIDQINDDTGWSPDDFYTQDATLQFKGSVEKYSSNQDVLELLLYSVDTSGAKTLAAPVQLLELGSDGQWLWDNLTQKLPDGKYSLVAHLTDRAGNRLASVEDIQTIVIDTVPEQNPAKKIVFTDLNILESETDNFKNDFLTNISQQKINGKVQNLNVETQKIWVQLLGMDGHLLSENYADVIDGAWSFQDPSLVLGEKGKLTTYDLKFSAIDQAGNLIKVSDQKFSVDLNIRNIEFSFGSGTESPRGVMNFPWVAFSENEFGDYYFQGIKVIDNILKLPKNDYSAGQFNLSFRDQAGNISEILSNPGDWRIENLSVSLSKGNGNQANGFGQDEIAGSIGQYNFVATDKDVNLSDKYKSQPAIGDVVTMNHISMKDGASDDSLKLTLNDVMHLGAKNSFSIASAFKDHLQMRIDGDVGDKIYLDNLIGGLESDWQQNASTVNLGGSAYRVFSNSAFEVDLFVQQSIQTIVL